MDDSTDIQIGSLRVDLTARRVFVGGEERTVQRIQFEVLLVLLNPPGRAVSYDELYRTVWHSEAAYNRQTTRVVDTAISRLRRAIGAERIVTLPAFGVRLRLEEER
jgi:DNA-binding response OmpR family regulator